MHRDEIEAIYWADLLKTASGRWLIKKLMDKSGCMITKSRDYQYKDNYYAGRSDLVWSEVVLPMTNVVGWGVIDSLKKELPNVSRD